MGSIEAGARQQRGSHFEGAYISSLCSMPASPFPVSFFPFSVSCFPFPILFFLSLHRSRLVHDACASHRSSPVYIIVHSFVLKMAARNRAPSAFHFALIGILSSFAIVSTGRAKDRKTNRRNGTCMLEPRSSLLAPSDHYVEESPSRPISNFRSSKHLSFRS